MRRKIDFVKYQGCGNDFIIKDEMGKSRTADRERSRLAKVLTDRNFGIGADGIIFIEREKGYDGSMRLFEPAGNEADMCGNGVRCVADYLCCKLGKTSVDILTKDGLKRIVRYGRQYRVDMGLVRTTRSDLSRYVSDKGASSDSMMDFTIRAGGRNLRGSLVNSGEPHFVTLTKKLDSEPLKRLGDAANANKERFPTGVNLNFVEIAGPHAIRIRTYERGVYDETLACGTGATASATVAVLRRWVKPGSVAVYAAGGRLAIDVMKDGRAFMTGPACPVFSGTMMIEL